MALSDPSQRTGDKRLVRTSGVLPPRHHSLFEALSHRPPRCQSPKSDRPHQLSHKGLCLVYYDNSHTDQMTPSHVLCLQPTSEPRALIYQTRHV
ncbi:hypothetical protein TNIN_51571 [Trichonephila inaurata madagascariensis]|uniref:Uncharacterized protein n=1 Tax=Trichonephila inaurata madagascariensis TaxID=2747483 RepID=A0A8X7CPA2_9ARAC|nr:hypothetical protein TNIN_51571 [Trichonephila inaurata madagascariensis]